MTLRQNITRALEDKLNDIRAAKADEQAAHQTKMARLEREEAYFARAVAFQKLEEEVA